MISVYTVSNLYQFILLKVKFFFVWVKSCVTNLLQNFITSVNKILRFCLVLNGSYPEQIHHLVATCVKLFVGRNMQLAVCWSACMWKISLYIQFISIFYIVKSGHCTLLSS